MNIYELNPYIRVAMHSILKNGTGVRHRIIFDYELIYIEDGNCYFEYDGKEYDCRPGSFIFLRPGIQHKLIAGDRNLSQPHIHFDLAYKSDSELVRISFKDRPAFSEKELGMIRRDIFADYPCQPFVSFKNKSNALEHFFNVIDAPRDTSGYLYQKSEMIKLLSLLIADNFPECFVTPEQSGVEYQIKDFIDSGQAVTMSLSDIEKQFSYNKFYIEKRFVKAFGISIIEYRNNKRMNSARELLRSRSVTEVSEKLGFGSIYAFSRAFKAHFGYPPSMANK